MKKISEQLMIKLLNDCAMMYFRRDPMVRIKGRIFRKLAISVYDLEWNKKWNKCLAEERDFRLAIRNFGDLILKHKEGV